MEVTTEDMTTTPEMESNSTIFLEARIAQEIWKFCSFILIVVGTVGNVLAICILVRRNMRSSTTMFYLTVMAVADIFVLYTGLLRYWVKNVFQEDLRLLSVAFCRAHLFLVYLSLDIAVWTMVVVTLDRAIFVCAPFRAKTLCTLRNARIVLVVLVITFITVNIHFLWAPDFYQTRTGLDCDISPLNWYGKVFHPWVDFCVYSVLPFSIMLICNCFIIRHIALSRRRLAAHAKREEQRVANGEVLTVAQPRKTTRKSRRPRCSNITVTLLTVNMVFLLTTFPVVLFLLQFDKWNDNGSEHDRAVLSLIWAVVNIFQYLNNAIHFFLYCLTGPKFRRELLTLFRRKNRVDIILDQSTTLDVYHTNTVQN